MIESAPRFGVESSFLCMDGVWCYPLSRSIHLEHKALNKWGENSFFFHFGHLNMTMCHGFSKKIAGGIKEFTIIGIDKNHTDYWWPVPES